MSNLAGLNARALDWMEKTSLFQGLNPRVPEIPMNTLGVFVIKGAPYDIPGGGNHRPILDVVEGRLYEVINYAMTVPGFFVRGDFGFGGSIAVYTPPVIRKIGDKR